MLLLAHRLSVLAQRLLCASSTALSLSLPLTPSQLSAALHVIKTDAATWVGFNANKVRSYTFT